MRTNPSLRAGLRYRTAKALCVTTALFATLFDSETAMACEMAEVLFGDIRLSVMKQDGFESAVVRHNNFDSSEKNYGALKGEITVDRGSFAVRNINQVVIGIITPDLIVEGLDDSCDKSSRVSIVPVKRGVYAILNGSRPVGTIEGRFPDNSFGVK